VEEKMLFDWIFLTCQLRYSSLLKANVPDKEPFGANPPSHGVGVSADETGISYGKSSN
jgi:hypothetical protein